MAESVTLSTAGTSLLLSNPGSGIDIRVQDYPPPDRNVLYAQSIDTEGGLAVARSYNNRTISITVRCFDTTSGGGQMLARLKQLQQVAGRIQYEGGGTLTRVLPTAGTINFDVLDMNLAVPSDFMMVNRQSADCSLTLTARPLGYGVEQTLSDHSETTLPVLRFTEASIPGDVPALGRLVVDNDSSTAQLWAQWGLRSKDYTTATGGSLFYEAETRLPQGGAALAARSGASGGTVVRQGTLTTNYLSMMSLASSGTAYPSHTGSYRVMARIYDPGGTAGRTSGGTQGNVSLALQWALGDFVNTTTNDAVSPPVINDFSVVDLGQVQLPFVVSGTQRWDGRVLAKGTDTNQSVDIDCVWMVPTSEGSGQVFASDSLPTFSALNARDDFTGIAASGTLNARSAPVGGTWATSGATTDFAAADAPLATDETMTRSTLTDTGNGRFAILGSSTFTDMETGVRIYLSAVGASEWQGAAVARWVDSSNWAEAVLDPSTNKFSIAVIIAGTRTTLASATVSTWAVWYQVRLACFVSGRIFGLLQDANGNTIKTLSGFHTSLATSGTLASGKPGFRDSTTGGGVARYYDNFYEATPNPADAAAYGNQSFELRSNQIRREDSSGAVWGAVGLYEGDYLLVPPSGQEARSSELIIKMSRNPIDSGPDNAIDDLSAQLFITPRYLVVPES